MGRLYLPRATRGSGRTRLAQQVARRAHPLWGGLSPMPKYRLGLIQTVVEGATVFVEAGDPEEAERLAIEMVNAGNVEWRFLQAEEDGTGVVSVDLEIEANSTED